MTTQIFALTGLHCNACVGRITKSLEPLAASVVVSLNPMQVVLTNANVGFDALRAAIESAGKYGLVPNKVSNKPPAQYIKGLNAMKIIANNKPFLSWLSTYSPLLLILTYILGGSVLLQVGTGGLADITAMDTMRYFMAGFFLVFSFFKLLDIHAFADAYSGYDVLAKHWRGWAKVYPFVELALGIAYLTNFYPVLTHWVTIIVMGFSAIGVIKAVLNKTQIQCACLGTVFKLPMSTVTIVEDVGMVVMAGAMLVMV